MGQVFTASRRGNRQAAKLELATAQVQVLCLKSPPSTTASSLWKRKLNFSCCDTSTRSIDSDVHKLPNQQKPSGNCTEIMFASPLPHSRTCKTLKMIKTADWDRIVKPMILPGTWLKIVYDVNTHFIHVIQKAEIECSW